MHIEVLPSFPILPSLCSVCMSKNSSQIIPERGESLDSHLEWKFYVFCPLCFDQLVDFFPITTKKIFNRQRVGKFYIKRQVLAQRLST